MSPDEHTEYDKRTQEILDSIMNLRELLIEFAKLPQVSSEGVRMALVENVACGLVWAQAVLASDRHTAQMVLNYMNSPRNLEFMLSYFNVIDAMVAKTTVDNLFDELKIPKNDE